MSIISGSSLASDLVLFLLLSLTVTPRLMYDTVCNLDFGGDIFNNLEIFLQAALVGSSSKDSGWDEVFLFPGVARAPALILHPLFFGSLSPQCCLKIFYSLFLVFSKNNYSTSSSSVMGFPGLLIKQILETIVSVFIHPVVLINNLHS